MTKANSAWAKLLGQDGNIIVPKAFADLMGSLDGGAVLSDLAYWQAKEGDWFWRTDALIAERQCISTYSAKHGRTRLMAAGLLEMKMQGQPAKAHYRLDLAAVLDIIDRDPVESLRSRPHQMIGAGPSELGGSSTGEFGGSFYIKEEVKEELKTVPSGTARAANDAAPRAPLATHTNGSTQPEPLASPGLPSVVVSGASPAPESEPGALAAEPKRSARNGKASANGSTPAEPDPARAAESKAVFGELCAWLGLDWARLPANTRGRLNKTTAALLDAGLGADAVVRARDVWRFDWRAKGGQVPDISQVEGLVARAGAGLTASETPGHYPRYGVHDAPARVKMSEVF